MTANSQTLLVAVLTIVCTVIACYDLVVLGLGVV